MSTADDLLSLMEHRRWEPAVLSNDSYVLEINAVHGKIEAGFVLWRKLPNGEPELVTSGHTREGQFWGAENEPLELNDEIQAALADLIRSA